MKTIQSVHRSLAVLALPRPVPALLTTAQRVVTAMTGNAALPTPTPTLAAVAAAIAALQTAQAVALARTAGAVTARNDRRTTLVGLLQELRGYVQKCADADPENSAAIIQSAGMSVKKVPVHKPRVFAATQGAVSGTVKLATAAAGNRASYDWETSVDGGKTWAPLPSTLQAKTTVAGLTAGTTVLFRYRAVTKTGVADWAQPVAVLVK